MAVRIRPYEEKDIAEASIICREAFGRFHQQTIGRRIDFVSEEETKKVFEFYYNHPKIIGVAAVDEKGKLIGTNLLDIIDDVATIGPISVSPDAQTKGAGAALMRAVIDIAKEKNFKSIRLVQEAYNLVSFSLYTKLGFDSKDQMTIFEGHISPVYSGDIKVRKMEEKDINECNEFHKQVIKVSRLNSLRELVASPTPPMVAEENGKIIGFSTGVILHAFFIVKPGKEEAIHALHCSFSKLNPHQWPLVKVIGRLYPTLARKCLTEWGLKAQRNLTLMAIGDKRYDAPNVEAGIYCPTMSY